VSDEHLNYYADRFVSLEIGMWANCTLLQYIGNPTGYERIAEVINHRFLRSLVA
jgi:hypothetical protein